MVFREGRPYIEAPLRGAPQHVRGAPQIDFWTDEGRPEFLPILQRFLLFKMTMLYINSVRGCRNSMIAS
eukprot:UN07236